MNQIRVFSDEDIQRAVADQLRESGIDAVSTVESGRRGASDMSQLLWAAQEQRVLLTCNVEDFARLHHEFLNQGQHHAGIVVSKQRTIGETIRRIIHLSGSLSGQDMQDRLEYLSNW